MRIGVISDTHGFLDPRIEKLFNGVEHILHGGDIGTTAVISALEGIAPVTAVLGNTDSDISFRETEVVTLAGRKFVVHHIVDVTALPEGIRQRIEREEPDVVVFGHTHKPYSATKGKTLFLNPGYAGKQRFNLARSVAILHCNEDGLKTQFLEL